MKVITVNLNGIDQAAERGFFSWLEESDVDVVCVQNMKKREYQMPDSYLEPEGFNAYFFEGEDEMIGGTGIYTRRMPKAVIRGLGFLECDNEGRFIQADFDDVSVCSFYVPEAHDEESQEKKFQFMDKFEHHLRKTRRKRRNYIFTGTINIAHRTIDLGNWDEMQRESGFLPEERAWMDQMLGPVGYVDAFRVINRQDKQYTWWPYDERQANGRRIDYQWVTPGLADYIYDARIITDPRVSPHCMLEVDYDL
jgi:exodeoxyribonuclease-3